VAKKQPKKKTVRLGVEVLEDRRVPALIGGQFLPIATPPAPSSDPNTLSAGDVNALLKRAAAATKSNDAIIAIVDRGGRVLGVRVEGGVSPAITGNLEKRVFAIDGALAEARTGAFFGNNQAPLTSRTIQFISQSTNTQREVESDPTIADPNSTLKGPGFVAPIGVKSHFPPNIALTPQVDLFDIEHTNRDIGAVDANGNQIATRFNINPAFIPGNDPAGLLLQAPNSYGVISGLEPNAKPRGIGTLPGGIPIYKNGSVVGGIGVFFPGTTGYADAENSSLGTNFDPTKPDRSLEAEFIAVATVGGAPMLDPSLSATGPLGGVALPKGMNGLPITPQNQRIDLVGITLDIVGPGGTQGPFRLFAMGKTFGVGTGNPNSGVNVRVQPLAAGSPVAAAVTAKAGRPVIDGWLVTPHAGTGLTAADVTKIVTQAIQQAEKTRAAIRLPLDARTRMLISVADRNGNLLGLFRMPDATIFSIDVAVAKSRNVGYYADPTQLQPIDQVSGVPPGTALTNRTFRYLAQPRFPEGIDGQPPGQFSILNDGGADLLTGLNVGAPLPASAFNKSVEGNDAFNIGTNFHQPKNPNQNGIVFFPGAVPLYKNGILVGGLGLSGDGVDQDDVITFAGAAGYEVPSTVLRADQTFTRGVRLPYQKFNRNPED
jgi:uncharacterized protein GlcG (DUF336 family)